MLGPVMFVTAPQCDRDSAVVMVDDPEITTADLDCETGVESSGDSANR